MSLLFALGLSGAYLDSVGYKNIYVNTILIGLSLHNGMDSISGKNHATQACLLTKFMLLPKLQSLIFCYVAQWH